MTSKDQTANTQVDVSVRRDVRAVRDLIKRAKSSVQLADLCLFGRRNPRQMLDYLDRRECYRSPVELPIYAAPAAFDGASLEPLRGDWEEIPGITKDVSRRGIGFIHDVPLEGDYAIVTVDLLDGSPVSLLLEVCWSNVERERIYMSGGRFTGIIDIR